MQQLAGRDPDEGLIGPGSGTGWSPRLWTAVLTGGVFLIYVALGMAANWTTWTHGISHTIQTSGGADVQEEIWFLAQTPWAILHGVNPLNNGWLNAPYGINNMDNTAMPLLGVLGAPITLLFGAIATYNALFSFGLALSALACFVVLRRFVVWTPAAFVGGLIYGFSSFAVSAGNGHLFLTFDVVPPLVVLVVDRTLRTRQTPPLVGGILLGLCLAAQFYISTEMFAGMVIMLGLAVVVSGAYVIWRKAAVEVGRVGLFAAAAAAVCALGTAYGAWMALLGPHHIVGPAQSRIDLNGLSVDPLGWIVPTINQRFTAGFAGVGDALVAQRDAHWRVVIDNAAENGSYIGIPLLVLLIVGAVALRRRRTVQLATVLAGFAGLLAMGSRLHIDGRLTGIPLPFIVLAHLPLLDSSVASRYMLFFWLFAAILAGIVLDAAHGAVGKLGIGRRWGPGVVCWSLIVVALLPLFPSWPYSAARWTTPGWFRGAARTLPVGSTVLVYPVAGPSDSSAMVWQADAHLTFRMPGGYAVFATPGTGTATFLSAASSLGSALGRCVIGRSPPVNGPEVMAQLARWHVNYVAVPDLGTRSDCVRVLFSDVLGEGADREGVSVWQVRN